MPAATNEQFLTVVLGLVAVTVAAYYVTGLLVNVKKIRQLPSVEDQYVTRSELGKLEASISQCALKKDLDKVADTLAGCASKAEVKELHEYTRKGFHDVREQLQPIKTDLALLSESQRAQDRQFGLLSTKFDESYKMLLEIWTLKKAEYEKAAKLLKEANL